MKEVPFDLSTTRHFFREDSMMRSNPNNLAAGLFLALASAPVLAHTDAGPAHGFVAGFLHPWQGADHLLAMLAVGLWAAVLGGRAWWRVPLSFIVLMSLGAALHFGGYALPHAEGLVSASVLALGLVLWRDWRAASGLAGAMAGGFALFHGYVHAAELGTGVAAVRYSAGLLLATAALHLLGLATGWASRGFELARKGFGLVCAGIGASLLAGL
jgi:urease accessory protein